MKVPASLFFRVFIKPFYKENVGAIVFVFTMMFFIVSTMDGAGMFAYHYSLVTSMLNSNIVFFLVFFFWFLYARKCAMFIADTICSPQFLFLHIINCLSRSKRFWLFVFVDVTLLLPVLSYAVFIVYAGCHQHLYLPVLLVVFYLILLCVIMAVWHVSVLRNPYKRQTFFWQQLKRKFIHSSSYFTSLLLFVAEEHKAIWVGVKIYTCGVLYLIARYNTTKEYDTLMAFLFFNFGILANGVLVYLIRQWEETYLSFFRSLPVSSFKKILNYLLLYGTLLIPEFITAFCLAPSHLHYSDAIGFCLCAYSLLLLMNSLLFLTDFSTKEFAIVLLGIFCVQYILLPTGGYVVLYLLFFSFAVALFFWRYHRFEKNAQKESV